MYKIRKGDIVEVTSGKDKGKKGKVLNVVPNGRRALVEGINLAKKHKRQRKQGEQGGIVSIEQPIAVANIAYFCKSCNRGVRVGFSASKEKTRTRYCKRCKETI